MEPWIFFLLTWLEAEIWHSLIAYRAMQWTNFHQIWHKASFCERDSKGYALFRGEIRNSQNTLTNWKIFFSRTTGVISTNLGTKHPWVQGILGYLNEGPGPREDNYKIGKLPVNQWTNLNQTWHKASMGKGNTSCSNEGPCPFPITKYW